MRKTAEEGGSTVAKQLREDPPLQLDPMWSSAGSHPVGLHVSSQKLKEEATPGHHVDCRLMRQHPTVQVSL